MTELEGTFCTRMGVVYGVLGRKDKELEWYKKGLEHRTKDSHVFWFKNLLFASGLLLLEMNRPAEALTLIEDVTREFPPLTPWETAQILTSKGICFEKLGDFKSADNNFMLFLKLTNEFPEMDPFDEFSTDYIEIANFYVSNSNTNAARLFLKKLIDIENKQPYLTFEVEKLLFRLDSLAGNYESALSHYMQFKVLSDSEQNMTQRKAFDELLIKYDTEKKEKDILLLQNESQLSRSHLNLTIGGIIFLAMTLGFLYSRYRTKMISNSKLQLQQAEINRKNSSLGETGQRKGMVIKGNPSSCKE